MCISVLIFVSFREALNQRLIGDYKIHKQVAIRGGRTQKHLAEREF